MDKQTGHASAFSDFDLAALACGHDPSTVEGRSAARHDHRVHDLLDDWAIAEHVAAARTAIDRSTQVSW